MASVQCKVEIPKVEGLPENTLTVGREFLLVCEGEFSRDLHAEKLQLSLKPESQYSLHLLSFEFRNPSLADVKVTAYKAGSFKFENLQLTDGQNTVDLGSVQYQVESVLQPPKQGEQQAPPQPYGPFGPMSLSVPPIYWGLVLACLGFFILLIAGKIFRGWQRRSMLEKLREHDSALSPLGQFHQNLRRLQRKNPVYFGIPSSNQDAQEAFADLRKGFLLFLTRKYQIPAMEWSERWILRDLKKYHYRTYKAYGSDVKALVREYSHGSKHLDRLSENDILNLTQRTRVLVEKMEASQ